MGLTGLAFGSLRAVPWSLSGVPDNSWAYFGRLWTIFWLLLGGSWVHLGSHVHLGPSFWLVWKVPGWVLMPSWAGLGHVIRSPPTCLASTPCLPLRCCSHCCAMLRLAFTWAFLILPAARGCVRCACVEFDFCVLLELFFGTFDAGWFFLSNFQLFSMTRNLRNPAPVEGRPPFTRVAFWILPQKCIVLGLVRKKKLTNFGGRFLLLFFNHLTFFGLNSQGLQ